EDCLYVMMARSPVQNFHVNVCTRPEREAFEEIMNEFGLKVADARHPNLQINHRMWPPAEVEGGHCQCFVHGHHKVAGAIDSATIPKRLRDCLTERNAQVFDGVVLVDVEIAFRVDPKIECSMPGNQLEHVIEKSNSGMHLVAALAVERDGQ